MTALTRQTAPSNPPSLPTVTESLPTLDGTRGWRLSRTTSAELEPLIKSDTQEAQSLAEFVFQAEKLMVPSSKTEIAGRIEALTVHYWTKALDPASAKIYVQDWLSDAGHLPPDILESACAQWRRSDKAFMPTPGQFLAIANPIHENRQFFIKRARGVLERTARAGLMEGML